MIKSVCKTSTFSEVLQVHLQNFTYQQFYDIILVEMKIMIIREKYLKKMIDAKDTEFIKVITGVRRSGKSTLLLMFKDYLLKNTI